MLQELLQRTTARVFVERAGASLRTADWLKLRADHAIARDAVYSEVDNITSIIGQHGLILSTQAKSKGEYLMRPDRGRLLDEVSIHHLQQLPAINPDVLFLVGDGLSAKAIQEHAPFVLDGLIRGSHERGWSVGPTAFIRFARVGILNAIGDLIPAKVIVLLIGERPGLATASSMSAYLAYRPHMCHTDADRNLISNIHANGITPTDAIPRILDLISQLLTQQISGVVVKEALPTHYSAYLPKISE